MRFKISAIFLLFLSIFVRDASAFFYVSTGSWLGFSFFLLFVLLLSLFFFYYLRRRRAIQRARVAVQHEQVIMTDLGTSVIYVTNEPPRNDFVPGSSYNYQGPQPQAEWSSNGIYNKNNAYYTTSGTIPSNQRY